MFSKSLGDFCLIRETSQIGQGVQRQVCGHCPWDTGVGGGTAKGCRGHIVLTSLLLQESVLHLEKQDMKQLVQSLIIHHGTKIEWEENRRDKHPWIINQNGAKCQTCQFLTGRPHTSDSSL